MDTTYLGPSESCVIAKPCYNKLCHKEFCLYVNCIIIAEQGAYSYVWTEECERLLPKHYKARCLDFMQRDPTPVHWRPDPRKYKLDKHGVRCVYRVRSFLSKH